jgi:uncharacterized protein YndB with AHSA1/START domain
MTETHQPEQTKKEVRVEKSIEVAAPVAEVWKALATGNGLETWFPLEARVTPGKGGKIFLSWGSDAGAEAEIVEWQPEKTLVSKSEWEGQISLVTWTLESRGEKTVVRLVQSGFSSGTDWDNEWFASTSYGWDFMLASLRFALERHRGEQRQVAWPRVKVTVNREEAYQRLTAGGSLFVESPAEALQPSHEYSCRRCKVTASAVTWSSWSHTEGFVSAYAS